MDNLASAISSDLVTPQTTTITSETIHNDWLVDPPLIAEQEIDLGFISNLHETDLPTPAPSPIKMNNRSMSRPERTPPSTAQQPALHWVTPTVPIAPRPPVTTYAVRQASTPKQSGATLTPRQRSQLFAIRPNFIKIPTPPPRSYKKRLQNRNIPCSIIPSQDRGYSRAEWRK